MNNIVFCIPSYRRAKKQKTLEYLESMGIPKEIIYISTQTEEDYNEYSNIYGKRASIIFSEGNCVSDNRNNILNKFPIGKKIVMLDDDLSFIGKLKDKKIVPFSKEQLIEFIQDAFNYCEKNNALVWTGYPVENGYFMSAKIDKKNFGVGCIMGIINSEYRFNRQYKIKEDFEFCLHQIKDGYNCIRFNFIHAKGDHKSKGGCETFWEKDEECTNRLLCEYPNLIKRGIKKNSILMRR